MIDRNDAIKHLRILNIPIDVDFTINDVQSAYKLMAKFYHPDINKSIDSDNRMKTINNSYEFIKNNFEEIKKLNLQQGIKSGIKIKNKATNSRDTLFKKGLYSTLKILSWIFLIGLIGAVIIGFIISITSGNA